MFSPRLSALVVAGLIVAATPDAAQPAEARALGSPKAPVTVEVFCDFLCPTCAAVRKDLARLVEAHPNQVRFVLREFPLRPDSGRVAEAAACAGDQGKYWEMREYLYSRQKILTALAVRQQARKLGIDGARFDQCLASRSHAPEWERDKARGRALGVSATPSFVVGNRVFEGFDEAALDRAIRQALRRR
jgi:protein-disulfide isomerase